MNNPRKKKINIELLEKAARALVASWPEERFDMCAFVQGEPEEEEEDECPSIGPELNPTIEATEAPFCGTAACFAGAMPWLGVPELAAKEEDTASYLDGGVEFDAYIERLFNISIHDCEWNFIFGGNWPDDKNLVLERVLHLKKHGTIEGYKVRGA